MKIFITGGAGFIGYHTSKALLEEGHEVIIFDSLVTGSMKNVDDLSSNGKLTFIEGDVRNFNHVAVAMQGCNAVLNLAALVSVTESIENPRLSFHVNTQGFFNVLEAARTLGIRRVVYASSAAVYGQRESNEFVDYCDPESPYGVDKLVNDAYAHLYHKLYGMETVGFRYFNVYGPRQDPKSPYAGVIAKFTESILEGKDITIFGDGHQTRSFIYVADIAKMNVLALTTPVEFGLSFNLANPNSVFGGVSVSLNELSALIQATCGVQVKQDFKPARPGEVRNSIADISKTERCFTLPDFTSLREGLKLTIESLKV